MIKPEIGKLPKAVVERIPLVIYIPPPPENEKDLITKPPHAYPPKAPSSNKLPERRFKLLRNFTFRSKRFHGEGTNAKEKMAETPSDTQTPSWEDGWEQSEYPFVALEGNRAACAICLMDFEEPKRKNPGTDINGLERSQKQEGTTTIDSQIGSVFAAPLSQGSNITEEHRQDQLKLEDAGDGAQPLRLLECGHVFHVCPVSICLLHSRSISRRKPVWILGSLMSLGVVLYARGLLRHQNSGRSPVDPPNTGVVIQLQAFPPLAFVPTFASILQRALTSAFPISYTEAS